MINKVTDTTLDNGIRVLTMQRESGSVLVAVNVQVGSMNEHEPPDFGAAHFLEHMMFKGTSSRGRLRIVREVEGRGGIFNAHTSHDGTMFWIQTTPKHMDHAIEILSDILFYSTLPEEEIEKERSVILEESAQYEDDPVAVLWKNFDGVMFKDTTRAHSILGSRDSVAGMTRDRLVKFREKYTADRVTVLIVGDLPYSIEYRMFGRNELPRTGPIEDSETLRATLATSITERISSKFDQSYLFVGSEGPCDRELYAMPEAIVASQLLGGGGSSLMFQRIREDLGLAYATGSFLDSNLLNGAFVPWAFVNEKNIEKTTDVIMDLMSDVASGKLLEEDALSEAKERVIGPMYIGSETNWGMGCKLLYSSLATGKYISLEEREAMFRQVSIAGIQEFFKGVMSRPNLKMALVPKRACRGTQMLDLCDG